MQATIWDQIGGDVWYQIFSYLEIVVILFGTENWRTVTDLQRCVKVQEKIFSQLPCLKKYYFP